jgi:hypothetical protein
VNGRALACCVALAGCSGLPSRASMVEEYAGRPIEEFRIVHLDNWEVVSKSKLVVHNGVNEAYLLTVWPNCDLRFVDVVGVTDTAGSVSKVEKVLADNQSCPISEIRRVDVRALEEDREALRRRQEKESD